jgi:glutamate-1-semialdehyde 2,1-aminomutase
MSTTDPSPTLPNDFFSALKARAPEIEKRYRKLTPASAALHEEAKTRLPGGFSRDAVIRKPYAPYIEGGEGAVLADADGRRIIDFGFNATSLALGHADPRVVGAVNAQLARGSAYYAPTRGEVELAGLICERLPCAERVRFTNSGSEAVMMGLRLARGFTGRSLIIKFEGSYHGTYDDVQWSVSPPEDAVAAANEPRAIADTGGLAGDVGRVLVLRYNDPDALKRAAERHGEEIAAVIMEPLANRMGLISPKPGFLAAARELCDSTGAVLIFDEVIAFRAGYNGTQGTLGVTPDLTTLGKCIGGGFPVGGVAGRADVLEVSAPGASGRVTHAGTFNANPITMTAGKATLEALTPEVFETLNATGERVRARLREICEGLPLRVAGAGSLFKVNALNREIIDHRDTLEVDKEWQEIASLALLAEGYFLSRTLLGCVSTATTDQQIDGFLEAFAAIVRA